VLLFSGSSKWAEQFAVKCDDKHLLGLLYSKWAAHLFFCHCFYRLILVLFFEVLICFVIFEPGLSMLFEADASSRKICTQQPIVHSLFK
jgi:hypothetical protein